MGIRNLVEEDKAEMKSIIRKFPTASERNFIAAQAAGVGFGDEEDKNPNKKVGKKPTPRNTEFCHRTGRNVPVSLKATTEVKDKFYGFKTKTGKMLTEIFEEMVDLYEKEITT